MQGGVSRIPEVGGSGSPHCKACLSSGRGLLFSTQMAAAEPAARKTPWLLPHGSPVSPTPDSPHRAPVCAALPLLVPNVSDCEHKTCALAPLRIKKEKEKNSGFVSSGSRLSPAVTNPVAFHHWVLHGLLILALELCAWEPGLCSLLLPFKWKLLQLRHLGLPPL